MTYPRPTKRGEQEGGFNSPWLAIGTGYSTKGCLDDEPSQDVALTGAGALALSLVGCGSDGGGDKDKSGLITQPKDTSKNAVKGGIWKSWISSDTRHFDPLSGGSSQIFFHSAHAYSRLLKYKMGGADDQLTGEVEPTLRRVGRLRQTA